MKLPPLYHVKNHYTYQRRKVTYVSRNHEYYRFTTDKGATLLIDSAHTWLIEGDRRKI